jgi:hypothetical protein
VAHGCKWARVLQWLTNLMRSWMLVFACVLRRAATKQGCSNSGLVEQLATLSAAVHGIGLVVNLRPGWAQLAAHIRVQRGCSVTCGICILTWPGQLLKLCTSTALVEGGSPALRYDVCALSFVNSIFQVWIAVYHWRRVMKLHALRVRRIITDCSATVRYTL